MLSLHIASYFQDGGCSCPGDVAKAFGKDTGRAQEEDPIEKDESPLRV